MNRQMERARARYKEVELPAELDFAVASAIWSNAARFPSFASCNIFSDSSSAQAVALWSSRSQRFPFHHSQPRASTKIMSFWYTREKTAAFPASE